MPIPEPAPREGETEFMVRCMTDDVMVDEYPDRDQRLAVCYAQWRERDGANADGADEAGA